MRIGTILKGLLKLWGLEGDELMKLPEFTIEDVIELGTQELLTELSQIRHTYR